MSRVPCLVLVHAVWSTQQRVRSLMPENDVLLLRLVGQQAKELRSDLVAGGCWYDHVHVLVRVAPSVALSDLIGRFKGSTAFELSRNAKVRQRVQWQRGYWAQSIGRSEVDRVLAYVLGQRDHHDHRHNAVNAVLEP